VAVGTTGLVATGDAVGAAVGKGGVGAAVAVAGGSVGAAVAVAGGSVGTTVAVAGGSVGTTVAVAGGSVGTTVAVAEGDVGVPKGGADRPAGWRPQPASASATTSVSTRKAVRARIADLREKSCSRTSEVWQTGEVRVRRYRY
jgi:hypothetical protein